MAVETGRPAKLIGSSQIQRRFFRGLDEAGVVSLAGVSIPAESAPARVFLPAGFLLGLGKRRPLLHGSNGLLPRGEEHG